MTALVAARDLVKAFPVRDGTVKAVSGVDLDIHAGETLALVGESGSGKSTVGQLLVRLLAPTAGSVSFDGRDLAQLRPSELRALRPRMQIVFQDPNASLNPRFRVATTLSEPLKLHARMTSEGASARVAELLGLVGLSPEHGRRFPHELSGGERQRVSIARALSLRPSFVVLDEPVSALDASIQAGIVSLLDELQTELGLAYLFISHDLAVVRHVADRVAVMYLGKIVEEGPRDDIYLRAAHPYTQALLSAIPVPVPSRQRRRDRIVLRGDAPSSLVPPSGCRFRTRCWKAQDICAQEEPALIERGHDHPVACHFAETRVLLAKGWPG